MDLLNCSYSVKQAGLFVWARVPNPINGFDLSNEVLYNANVFISPGGIFGSAGENYLRVSLCTPEERFIESIRRIKEYLSTKTVTHV
jgi:aspartate/methionine/tyrosine aminotransferase